MSHRRELGVARINCEHVQSPVKPAAGAIHVDHEVLVAIESIQKNNNLVINIVDRRSAARAVTDRDYRALGGENGPCPKRSSSVLDRTAMR